VPDEWFTLRDAAIRLGVSEGAIRKRVARGTIRSQMGTDGLRYVWLEGEDAGDGHVPDGGTDVLVEELRDRKAFLQRQLQSREEELRRRDAILMNMTEALKALTPPREESSESPEPRPDRPAASEATAEAQEATERQEERKGWFRKFFGLYSGFQCD
jgi:hypothetical protein